MPEGFTVVGPNTNPQPAKPVSSIVVKHRPDLSNFLTIILILLAFTMGALSGYMYATGQIIFTDFAAVKQNVPLLNQTLINTLCK